MCATVLRTAWGAGKCEMAIEKSITSSPATRMASTWPCTAVVANGVRLSILEEMCIATLCVHAVELGY